MKWFKADRSKCEVREVEGPASGYPELDSEGSTMYNNSHFKKEEQAIAELIVEYTAGIELGAHRVRQLKGELHQANDHLADTAEKFVRAKEMLEAFKARPE